MKSARDDLNFTISPIPRRRRMRARKETDNEMKYSKEPLRSARTNRFYRRASSFIFSNLLMRLFCTFCAIQTSKSFQTSHQLQRATIYLISSPQRRSYFRLFDFKHIVKCSFKSALWLNLKANRRNK